MDWFLSLFIGGGITHTVLVLSLVIAIGVFFGKIKIAGISIGVTWILFVGILAGHLGMSIDSDVLHFIKEFGLILFVLYWLASWTRILLIIQRWRNENGRMCNSGCCSWSINHIYYTSHYWYANDNNGRYYVWCCY